MSFVDWLFVLSAYNNLRFRDSELKTKVQGRFSFIFLGVGDSYNGANLLKFWAKVKSGNAINLLLEAMHSVHNFRYASISNNVILKQEKIPAELVPTITLPQETKHPRRSFCILQEWTRRKGVNISIRLQDYTKTL